MIEALERTWKEAGGTEVNHENISGDPVHIMNRHLRNAIVERCYHASKFCSGNVEVLYPLSYNCVEKCTVQNWSVFSPHILKCQGISTSSLRTVASSQCEMYMMRYAEESPLSSLLWYDIYLLPPGDSSIVRIYTQTIHRTTQNKQYKNNTKIARKKKRKPQSGDII
jgi:hypothetical protein